MIRRGYVARTWIVPGALARQVHALAEELQVNDSELVVKLLNFGFGSVETGKLTLQTRVARREFVEDEEG